MTAAYLSLLLADGRLPTGAHTQSAGVEPALAHGMRLDQLPDYLSVRLQTVTEVEAAAAVVTRRVWLDTVGDDRRHELTRVDWAWRVRTPAEALRDAADLLGRSYLRMAATVWDLSALNAPPQRVWCRAVVMGCAAAAAGLSAAETARVVAFEDVQTAVSAALKLVPFDPSQGVRWSVAAAAEVEEMVQRVAELQTVADLPAHSAPQIEEWGQRHQTTQRRLFRA
jgi:urease accessory protein